MLPLPGYHPLARIRWRSRSGELVSRLTADTLLVQDAVSLKLSVFLRYSLQVAIGVILMSLISIRLTLALLTILPILIAISILLGKKLRFYSKRQQQELAGASGPVRPLFGRPVRPARHLARPGEADP